MNNNDDSMTESSENSIHMSLEQIKEFMNKPEVSVGLKVRRLQEHIDIHAGEDCFDLVRFVRQLIFNCTKCGWRLVFTKKESDLLPDYHKIIDDEYERRNDEHGN